MQKSIVSQLVAVFAASSVVMCIGASSATTKPHPKPAPKLIIVNTCPVSGGHSKDHDAGFEVVGKYKAYFCCAGCQTVFDKMKPAEKLAKVKAAALTDKAPK